VSGAVLRGVRAAPKRARSHAANPPSAAAAAS